MNFKLTKIVLINVIIFFSLIIIIEIIFFLLPKNNKLDCHYLLCNRTFQYNTNLHEGIKNYNIIYERDEYGFRHRHKELNDIDILVVGGSTTDERYLNIKDTWINQLEEKLKTFYNKDIDIVNSGIDGQSSFGHLWNFKNWYSKLNFLTPKYIIFYIGINEVLYITPEEKKRREKFDNSINIQEYNILNKIKYILRKNQGIVYKSYVFLRGLIIKNNEVAHSNDRKKSIYKIPSKKTLINNYSKDIFLNNLNLIYEYSIQMKSIPIFITQKTMRGKKIDDQVLSISEFDYFSYEEKLSEFIIDFCKEKNIFCIDVNKSFNLSVDDTYDLVHLSPNGSKKLSVFLFERLKNQLKF
jgi:hypothetical protein